MVQYRFFTCSGSVLFQVSKHLTGAVHRLSLSAVGWKVLSIGTDDCIRICTQRGGTMFGNIAEQSRFTHDLALSDEEEFIVHMSIFGVVKIWKLETSSVLNVGMFDTKALLVFQSSISSVFSPAEASAALRKCFSKSSMLWPTSIERDSGDFFYESTGVYYSSENGTKKLLAFMPSAGGCQLSQSVNRWEYCLRQGTLVTDAGGTLVIGCVAPLMPLSESRPAPKLVKVALVPYERRPDPKSPPYLRLHKQGAPLLDYGLSDRGW